LTTSKNSILIRYAINVVKLMQHIIDVEIATGPDKGRRVFIPHLSITPSDTERMPFTLRRQQFPLRPTFAMTINKAHGQTLQTVGVYLPKPVFCHMQLYVAFSWCGSRRGVRVLVQGGSRAALNGGPAGVYTSNVVYREVL
jgi:ATP-dependent DNA helicase PIF1